MTAGAVHGIDRDRFPEPAQDSRAMPSVGGNIIAQLVQPQGEIPEDGRKNVCYLYPDCTSSLFLFQVVHLQAYVPDPKDFQKGNLKFENEEIRIVRQPCYDQSRKAAVGDKISLSCVAVCKHPIVYEWLKQVRQDNSSALTI